MSFKNSRLRVSFYSILVTMMISAAACASSGDVRGDKNGLKNGRGTEGTEVRNEGVKYEDYLVDINSYSTNGAYYQKKYKKDIIGLARDMAEQQDMDISIGSVGFYYDKKSNRPDRLFFGFDIVVNNENRLNYSRFSVKLIKEYVADIADEIYKYSFVRSEKEVVGIVIGFKWRDGSIDQQVNIWIKKEDVALFVEERLTANEMFQRGSITNSRGRIILLPI